MVNARISVLGDDEMVQEFNTEYFPGIGDLLRDIDICLARFGVSRRMIMRENNGRCSVFDGGAKNFAGMYDVAGKASDGDDLVVYEPVLAVEVKPSQVFFGKVPHVFEMFPCLHGGANDGRLVFGCFKKETVTFEYGHDLACFSDRDAK